ncbi:UNVERIFIED_CONTAM: Outer envelope protein 64, mitochondrial [Sesamum angustifolium]|uniref:Outer envelope protein 64, mitochondrial n=1 Tax=Sesamum angustifolium TaxID=2727405 RepID=A0AAW2IZ76_9LAMI
MSKLSKLSASNPRVWVIVGVGLAGILILAEVQRRRIKAKSSVKEDFGAFVERFELLPFPQPTPPAARLPLSGLTFAINDKILGENSSYGTPTNPQKPSHVPGGSSSGSAVAVAAQLVDFAIGTDTIGCIRVPASFCGILGFRPSHGIVSMIGVSPNSQSLDAVGCLAFDPSVLHRVGHSLLQLNPLEPKRTRCIIIADDLFQLSKVPMQKIVHVVSKVTEKLSGYQPPKHVNFGEFIASNVPASKSSAKNQQVAFPFGKLDDCPFSLSFIASHGNDKFLLDTVLDMYASLQEEVNTISSPSPLPYSNGDMDAAELLKEKGLLCSFQQAEEDFSKAISLDKKNVEAYLRRGTARDSLLFYRESLQDFKHALVLEPQNKAASLTEKRLRKLIS